MIYETFYFHNCSFQLKPLANVTPGGAETHKRQIVDKGYSPKSSFVHFITKFLLENTVTGNTVRHFL